MNLSKSVKVTRVSNAVVAGTADINSSSVDMQGYLAAEFVVAFGAITTGAVTSAKLQGSNDNTAWSDLERTGQTVADTDDNKLFVLDAGHPRHRYLRCVVDRGTQNAVVDSIISLQYLSDKEPVAHDATTVGGSEHHHAPAAGTA